MRTIRRAVAAFAAFAVVSACGVGQDGDRATTSSAVTEEPGNPWDLPIEQRPPLFDPCAEIPIEAVEEGVGGPVEPSEQLRNHRPGELFSCAWKNGEVLLGVIGTWRSKQEFLEDTGLVEMNPTARVVGRVGLRARDRGDESNTTCYHVLFTDRGAVILNVNLIDPLNSFRGKVLKDACEVSEHAISSVREYLPEGEF
ncbi:DUF3558 family protein [Dietzia sp. SYD-A1]|uniref:DUF3558 family protein n=1 Tax=Dietzia sp. SYD-A1 TaxID=2780141 RepID=UPI0018915462|nr:DUF3558 family protein [Dietzia sp. SYD-A1]